MHKWRGVPSLAIHRLRVECVLHRKSSVKRFKREIKCEVDRNSFAFDLAFVAGKQLCFPCPALANLNLSIKRIFFFFNNNKIQKKEKKKSLFSLFFFFFFLRKMLSLVFLALAHAAPIPDPRPYYSTAFKDIVVNGYKCDGPPKAIVYYPTNGTKDQRFPVISFVHGSLFCCCIPFVVQENTFYFFLYLFIHLFLIIIIITSFFFQQNC